MVMFEAPVMLLMVRFEPPMLLMVRFEPPMLIMVRFDSVMLMLTSSNVNASSNVNVEV